METINMQCKSTPQIRKLRHLLYAESSLYGTGTNLVGIMKKLGSYKANKCTY